jgi:ABC-type transporter Mla subunit MlaD
MKSPFAGICGSVHEAKGETMASLKDVERVADDLTNLVDQLRKELQNSPSFDKLVQIADQISERADQAAGTFSTVNEALMSRIKDLPGTGSRSTSGSSKSKARA